MEIRNQRVIFHVDMDAFFVSVERRENPALNGKPVIVGGSSDQRGVVSACSYEARKFGVHSAMPLREAGRRCPDAIFISGEHGKYSAASREIFKIIREFAPIVDQASIDEAYLDMTGCEKLFGPPIESATKLVRRIESEQGVAASIGIASSRLIAKMSSRLAKPRGILYIPPEHERRFIAPLPVGAIPGIGPVSVERYNRIGVFTIDQLSKTDPELLQKLLGKSGLGDFNKANAIDQGTVSGERDSAKSIGAERTFNQDINRQDQLEAVIFKLSEKVGSRLRHSRIRGRCITLKLRYSNFKTITRAQTLSDPTNADSEIFATAKNLFNKNYQHGKKVRLLGVTASALCTRGQLDLLDRSNKIKRDNLYRAVDDAREKYGFDLVRGGSSFFSENFSHSDKISGENEDDN